MGKQNKMSNFDWTVLFLSICVMGFYIRGNGFNWATGVFMLACYLMGVLFGAKIESIRQREGG